MTTHTQNDKRRQAIDRDVEILGEFVEIYCRGRHGTQSELCPQCRQLLEYACERRRKCPQDPKPKCRDCSIACYREPYRSQIGQIMKYSSVRVLRPSRLGKLLRLVFGNRRKRNIVDTGP